MGVVSSVITAGAGIAQAPLSIETRNGAAKKKTTKILEQRN